MSAVIALIFLVAGLATKENILFVVSAMWGIAAEIAAKKDDEDK